MDLLNRKVFSNIQRSLWTSRTSGHSVWRYTVAKLVWYSLLNQGRNCEKLWETPEILNVFLLLVMIRRQLFRIFPVLSFVWFSIHCVASFGFVRSFVSRLFVRLCTIVPSSFHLFACFVSPSFIRFVCSICFRMAYWRIFTDVTV